MLMTTQRDYDGNECKARNTLLLLMVIKMVVAVMVMVMTMMLMIAMPDDCDGHGGLAKLANVSIFHIPLLSRLIVVQLSLHIASAIRSTVLLVS